MHTGFDRSFRQAVSTFYVGLGFMLFGIFFAILSIGSTPPFSGGFGMSAGLFVVLTGLVILLIAAGSLRA